jgi:hypothetical protein
LLRVRPPLGIRDGLRNSIGETIHITMGRK